MKGGIWTDIFRILVQSSAHHAWDSAPNELKDVTAGIFITEILEQFFLHSVMTQKWEIWTIQQ